MFLRKPGGRPHPNPLPKGEGISHTPSEIPGAPLPERWRRLEPYEHPGPHCLTPDQIIQPLFPVLEEGVDVLHGPNTIAPLKIIGMPLGVGFGSLDERGRSEAGNALIELICPAEKQRT